MEKQDHIEYWKAEAEENWNFAQRLVVSKDWVYSLFYFHLTLEKLFKALWVKENIDNAPPRSHDLQYLHNQTSLNLDAETYSYLAIVSSWNLESRYPDYKRMIYKRTDGPFTLNQLEKVKAIRECLLSRI